MKKKKSKKRKYFKKLNEDQQTNLILLGILAFAGLLYYFGFLGTLVKGALSLWVLWALLAGFCAALLYWKETIGFILFVFGMIIVTQNYIISLVRTLLISILYFGLLFYKPANIAHQL